MRAAEAGERAAKKHRTEGVATVVEVDVDEEDDDASSEENSPQWWEAYVPVFEGEVEAGGFDVTVTLNLQCRCEGEAQH